jgi:hypothetical protein
MILDQWSSTFAWKEKNCLINKCLYSSSRLVPFTCLLNRLLNLRESASRSTLSLSLSFWSDLVRRKMAWFYPHVGGWCLHALLHSLAFSLSDMTQFKVLYTEFIVDETFEGGWRCIVMKSIWSFVLRETLFSTLTSVASLSFEKQITHGSHSKEGLRKNFFFVFSESWQTDHQSISFLLTKSVNILFPSSHFTLILVQSLLWSCFPSLLLFSLLLMMKHHETMKNEGKPN